MIDNLSINVDKMIKHNSLSTISKPRLKRTLRARYGLISLKLSFTTLKFIFTGKFYIESMSTNNISLHTHRGEKRLDTGDDNHSILKLDTKLVLLYDNTSYHISSVESAPYAGPKKIKPDRSKLLVEAKAIYDKVMGLNVNGTRGYSPLYNRR